MQGDPMTVISKYHVLEIFYDSSWNMQIFFKELFSNIHNFKKV